MARGGKGEIDNATAPEEANPEAEERKRRKKMALSRGIISEVQAKPKASLRPSKTVAKHHGADIIRRSQRKNRFLFSFPGLIAPVAGGKIGELKDLGTKNPVLYLDFPQGQMKLFGTIVYPKNRYLTLQFSRGGKNVMCEDYFDTMIVFSDAWWIGSKDENPEEARLELPKELYEEHESEFDFKGGAGGASEVKQLAKISEEKIVERESPRTDIEDVSDDQTNVQDFQEVTPSRHSERTAGRRFNFAEGSSGDDFFENHVDTSEDEDNEEGLGSPTKDNALGMAEVFQAQQPAKSITKSKEKFHSNRSPLVQTTISSLFKKVEEEKAPKKLRKSPPSKAASQSLQHVAGSKTDKAENTGPRKKRKVVEEHQADVGSEYVANEPPEDSNSTDSVKIYKRKKKNAMPTASVSGRASRVTASKVAVPTASTQVDEDDIEEFSSTSKDSMDAEGSDEDWAG